MVLTNYLNYVVEKLNPLQYWWFAGILVLFYWSFNYLFIFQTETVEWATYFFAFIVLLLLFIVDIKYGYYLHTKYKLCLSLYF